MAIEDRIELSERGHDTLEQKRDGLIMEFMDILDQAQDVREDLNANYDVAQRKLNMARAMEGDVAVRGAAAALKEHPLRSRPSRKHHGGRGPADRILESPQIPRRARVRTARLVSSDRRGRRRLRGTARNDHPAAEVETAMKKMLKEIETTKRRVNALEFKLLPDLYENQEYIEQKLEEQATRGDLPYEEDQGQKRKKPKRPSVRPTMKAATSALVIPDTRGRRICASIALVLCEGNDRPEVPNRSEGFLWLPRPSPKTWAGCRHSPPSSPPIVSW